MKRVVIPGVIALALVSGCGSSDSDGWAPKETSAPSEAQATTILQGSTIDDIFIEALSDQPYFEGLPEDMLIDMGKLICIQIDMGRGPEDFTADALSNDIPPYVLGELVGASIGAYCPENTGKFFN